MPQARILYLEDDHSLGLLCSEVLVKAGYSVCWKHDGISGLRALQNGEFDIGVVDIMMPDMDGYAFLKELRELSNYMPVILVSARVMTEDVLRGFDLGADDYMRKPFSIEELIVRINRLLKDRKAETDTDNKTIRIGKYLFMPSMLQLKIGDEVIELSPRTCAILQKFVATDDHTITRKDTLIDLWGDDTFFNGRSLDVFISKLRKTLSRDPDIRIISIRGIAFRLIIGSRPT